jgi:1-acyl-sn-glycerol-3-phosphate acyltransferase
LAPFIGDDEFQHHLMRMLRQPAVEVGVIAHPVVTIDDSTDLTDVTRDLRQTVHEGLRQIQAGRLSDQASDGPTAVAGPEL